MADASSTATTPTAVAQSHICELLEFFGKNFYKARDNDPEVEKIEQKCLELFGQDYVYSVISNANGELCNNYPGHLVVLEYEKYDASSYSVRNHWVVMHGSLVLASEPYVKMALLRSAESAVIQEQETMQDQRNSVTIDDGVYQSIYDAGKIREQILKARFARCRARFPLPVILFEGKYVCRSSTLSGGPEIYGRSGYDFLFSGGESVADSEQDEDDDPIPIPQASSDWQLFDKVRSQDIKLLRMLSIRTICDLMVENKKVKFGMNVTSSEKVDKEKRYNDFSLISLPYPGCEFFRVYRDCGYNAEGLVFDWNQSHIDTNIVVPTDPIAAQLNIDWSDYKSWDLVRLTQNYFRLILRYLTESPSGILVHCISGWDRTPLFISLLRLSLWADGKVHSSLGPNEILYLTLAYDWFLCGHNLADRLSKGEEILFFCFYFLKHLLSDEFAVRKRHCSCHHGRNKAESFVDGVLLEEERRNSVCGSNTSLSSNCSSLSYRSQDNPPTLFTNADLDGCEDALHQCIGNGNHWRHFDASSSTTHTQNTYSSTTPMAVPLKTRRRSDSGSSASCGSWQIITGTGSVRGSTNEVQHTSSSDASSHSKLSQSSLCDIMESDASLASSTATITPASRRERLQSVRSCFYSQYCASVGFRNQSGSETSRLSNLFDQFAEKVGIRSTGSVNKPT